MELKNVLVEGKNGELYSLGIGPRSTGGQNERPTIWRVSGAQLESLEESRTASSINRDRLDLRFSLQPGFTHDEQVKWATLEAMTGFITKLFRDARW